MIYIIYKKTTPWDNILIGGLFYSLYSSQCNSLICMMYKKRKNMLNRSENHGF